jgi:hypothetical protein
MLLGAEDFRTLMGNPRGKLMLHSSWLHGSGVVWGFPVDMAEDGQLRVGPGLAIDGRGRELALHSPQCIDVAAWAMEQRQKGSANATDPCSDPEPTVACLVATYELCPTRPVPALADPCDQQRTTTEASRLVETVHLELQPSDCPEPPSEGPYHRVRVLLGLDSVGSPDLAGKQAADTLEKVLSEPPGSRVGALLAAFRRLLAEDVTDLGPGDSAQGDVYPLPDGVAGVPLARIEIRRDTTGTYSHSPGPTWTWDLGVRRGLMATSTIQELACGLAPGLLGGRPGRDADGPRVKRNSVGWEDDGATLVFEVDKPLQRSTLTRNQVMVSSLGPGGWDREDIDDLQYAENRVVVRLFQPPSQAHVRLIVRGTGPTPVTGTTGTPLAGLDDGVPGTRDEGHDAVLRLDIDRRTP